MFALEGRYKRPGYCLTSAVSSAKLRQDEANIFETFWKLHGDVFAVLAPRADTKLGNVVLIDHVARTLEICIETQ